MSLGAVLVAAAARVAAGADPGSLYLLKALRHAAGDEETYERVCHLLADAWWPECIHTSIGAKRKLAHFSRGKQRVRVAERLLLEGKQR